MKKILIVILFIHSINIFAEDFFQVAPVKFQINATNVLEKLESTIKYPENLLKRYTPEGATITHKKVSGNTLVFTATKSVMFVSKSVTVNGVLDAKDEDNKCDKNENGYLLTLDLAGSDQLVYANIDRFETLLCVKLINQNQMIGVMNSKIYKGRDFSSFTGGIAKDIIEAQAKPLLKALSEEIKSLK